MATLTAAPSLPLWMRGDQLFRELTDAKAVIQSGTSFTVTVGNGVYTFTGAGFSTPNGAGFPKTGVIFGITYSAPGDGQAVLTGISMQASAFNTFLPDKAALHAALFAGNDVITGSSGKDWLMGYDGDDTLYGGLGRDVLDGGRGADKMVGGGGGDLYIVDNVGDRVIENPGTGEDIVRAWVSFDARGQDIERVELYGRNNTNVIGNDLDNTLVGSAGNNVIVGGGGRDLMTGGAGADRFDFNAVSESPFGAYDRITDLSNQDVIDLSTIDANTRVAGNQTFTLVDAFTGVAGQLTLTWVERGGFTVLDADTNGNGIADFRVILNGDHRDFDNFIL